MIISGSILNNDFAIIPFANVVVIGENRSTTSDKFGKFSIVVNNNDSILRFSHAGYDYDEVSAGAFLEFGYINLFPSQLDEVIIYNPNKPKSDNTLLYIIGGVITFFIGKKLFFNNQKSVKV